MAAKQKIQKLLGLLGCMIFMQQSLITTCKAQNNEGKYEIEMKRDLLCLMMAYPEHAINLERTGDRVYLIMKSGRKILYDDRRNKSYEGKLADADLQDSMEQLYPLSDITAIMPKDFSPGRIRCYSLLQEVYGASQAQVQAKLVAVRTGFGTFMFNGNNNAANALKKAMSELGPMAQRNSRIAAALVPSSGTFNYRSIAGTGRLSPHAFGTAIDLARDKRDYWKWATREQGEKRLQEYPREVVNCFEKNGFIWGGKWAQFDILHFEYRPELILKGKYFTNVDGIQEQWYMGAPEEDEKIRKCIEIINKAFEGNKAS